MTPYCPNSNHRKTIRKFKQRVELLRNQWYLKQAERNGVIFDESKITVEMLKADLANTDWIEGEKQ